MSLEKAIASSRHLEAVGRYEQARDVLLQAGVGTAEDPDGWFQLAGVQIQLEDLDAAESALRAGLALAPEDPVGLAFRVHLLKAQHRFDDAAAAARLVVQIHPSSATAHCQLAGLLSRSGDHEGAAAAAGTAVELAPDDPFAHAVLADVLWEAGIDDLARIHARRAVALDPDDPSFRTLLGVIEATDGDVQTARHLFLGAAAVRQDARDALGILDRARAGLDPGAIRAAAPDRASVASSARVGLRVDADEAWRLPPDRCVITGRRTTTALLIRLRGTPRPTPSGDPLRTVRIPVCWSLRLRRRPIALALAIAGLALVLRALQGAGRPMAMLGLALVAMGWSASRRIRLGGDGCSVWIRTPHRDLATAFVDEVLDDPGWAARAPTVAPDPSTGELTIGDAERRRVGRWYLATALGPLARATVAVAAIWVAIESAPGTDLEGPAQWPTWAAALAAALVGGASIRAVLLIPDALADLRQLRQPLVPGRIAVASVDLPLVALGTVTTNLWDRRMFEWVMPQRGPRAFVIAPRTDDLLVRTPDVVHLADQPVYVPRGGARTRLLCNGRGHVVLAPWAGRRCRPAHAVRDPAGRRRR